MSGPLVGIWTMLIKGYYLSLEGAVHRMCVGMWYLYVCFERCLKLEPEREKNMYIVYIMIYLHIHIHSLVYTFAVGHTCWHGPSIKWFFYKYRNTGFLVVFRDVLRNVPKLGGVVGIFGILSERIAFVELSPYALGARHRFLRTS